MFLLKEKKGVRKETDKKGETLVKPDQPDLFL